MAGGLAAEVGDVITISRSPLPARLEPAAGSANQGPGPPCLPDAGTTEPEPTVESDHRPRPRGPLRGRAATNSTDYRSAGNERCHKGGKDRRDKIPTTEGLDTNPGLVRLPPFSAATETSRLPEEFRVSVRDLLTLDGRGDSNPLIRPHDVVRVAKAGVIYVLGGVKKPGGFRIKDQEIVTVLRAVSLAGGLGRHAAPRKARIIRQSRGLSHEIPLSIHDILRGRAPDSPLEPNDILFIPDSRAKSALSRSAEAAIQMGTGIVIWRR